MQIPRNVTHIIGIDEAGRGPLAGPVAVGAVAVPVKIVRHVVSGKFGGVKESKQLTSAAREAWLSTLVEARSAGYLDFRCAFSSERVIDRTGIVSATARALARAITELSLNPSRVLVLLDGGLKAPGHFGNQKTIIRGDESEALIALASIVAKVHRDRKMIRYAARYPEYGFERHKGYGTAFHFECIAQYGLTPIHRASFLKK